MPGSIWGNVVCKDTGQSMPHVIILGKRYSGTALTKRQTESMPISIIANPTGWFVIDGLQQGRYLVQAMGTDNRKLGETLVPVFDDATSSVTIETQNVWTYGGNITHDELTGTLRGQTVFADTGAPVPNVSISIACGGIATSGISTCSDANGVFVVNNLPAGEWVLLALGPNKEIGQTAIRVTAGAVISTLIELLMSCEKSMSTTVRGRVIHAKTGDPVSNAAITVLRGPASVPDISPLTDDTGGFSFDGFPPGVWTLHAMGPNSETGNVTVEIGNQLVANILIEIE